MIKNSKIINPSPIITNYQIMQSMRSTLLQIQCLIHYLGESIQQQDNCVQRQIKDRLMQLMEVYQRHSQIQLSNTTKYLILQLQQILQLQNPILQKVWQKLDVFIQYLKGLKNMVKNFTRKIYFGRNIGIDIQKLNVLVKKTKVFLLQLLQQNKQSIAALTQQRELSNQIFSAMQQYCSQLYDTLAMLSIEYPVYIQKKLKIQQQITKKQIQQFTNDLLK